MAPTEHKTASRKKSGDTPWEKPDPKKKSGKSKTLTAAQKETAKKSAKAAGRPYPNMVDNMKVARKAATAKKTAHKKT